jgi:flavin reductase (DIM6/NTAB) family NADH-FMN oxidoreductase RutF
MAEKLALETRDALRMIAPGAVSLVTSTYHDQPNIMTAGWTTSLSLAPTYIGVAIQPGRLTHEFVTKSEQFALNFPNIDLLAAVHRCGMISGREEDKFVTTGLTPEEATEIEAPLLGECVGHIEFGVIERISFGDHDLFVGRVLAVSVSDEAFSGGIWNVETDAGQLLHHLGGDRYASLSKSYRASLEQSED